MAGLRDSDTNLADAGMEGKAAGDYESSAHLPTTTQTHTTMADISTSAADKKEKEYFTSTPQETPGFFLKGSHQYDWGLKNRLSPGLQSEGRPHRDARL